MSKADWTFLEHLLEEGQQYSTGIGRIWLTVLFLFRMLVLGTAAESAWDDEQLDFVCNTKQPGCTAVCYDKAFPISHFRYFVLQVIFVSTPTIFFFGYVAIRAGKEKNTEEEKDESRAERSGGVRSDHIVIDKSAAKENAQEKNKEENGEKGKKYDRSSPEAPKLKGRLLCAYAFSILLKILLEAGFIIGLWFLYDGFLIVAKFECTTSPCPHTVDCFVSRPTEKTIFTIYTQVIAAVSLLLNLLELFHLLQLTISHRLEKRYRSERLEYLPRSKRVLAREEAPDFQMEPLQSYKAGSHGDLPPQGEVTGYQNSCEIYRDLAVEGNWGSGEPDGDLLPSYMNCMGAMSNSHSPRVMYKKHQHHTEKPNKGAHKGHSKQKHYV